MPHIIEFYSGTKVDSFSYSLEEILNFNYTELEKIHNYIQLMFPTDDTQNIEKEKPYVAEEEINKFKENSAKGNQLRNNLFNSYIKIMDFYGFDVLKNKKLRKSENYNVRKNNWISTKNHNYLRLTRIISCLKLLGLEEYAKELFEALKIVYDENKIVIGQTTLNFWQQAIDGTLPRVPPKTDIFYNDLKEKLGKISWGA